MPILLKKINDLFIYWFYFWLHWVFVVACGLSLIRESGGYSPVEVCELPIAVVSLVAEHGL